LSSTSVTPATATGDRPPGQRTVGAGLAWAAGTVVVAAVLFGCYLLQSRTTPAAPRARPRARKAASSTSSV